MSKTSYITKPLSQERSTYIYLDKPQTLIPPGSDKYRRSRHPSLLSRVSRHPSLLSRVKQNEKI